MRIEKIKQVIKENRKEFVLILGTLGILVLILYISDVKCLVKYTVGVPCPGCGLTRAWLSFLKMDLRAAFRWHPLFWIVPIVVIIEVFMKGKLFKNKKLNIMFWIFLSILIIGVYSVRMIMLFPHEEPMDYNRQSLLYKWHIIKILE